MFNKMQIDKHNFGKNVTTIEKPLNVQSVTLGTGFFKTG